MGVGYAIGFSISGLKFGITLGLLFGLLNIVPYLGSIVGIITALLVAYLQPGGIAESGEWTVLLGCGISFVVVQLIESYYLTPKIMGQQTGLHPVVVMVSIFLDVNGYSNMEMIWVEPGTFTMGRHIGNDFRDSINCVYH